MPRCYISQYPVVEAINGCLTLFLFMRFGRPSPFSCCFIFCCAMVVITFIDLEHQIIPDVISLPGIVAGFALLIFHSADWVGRPLSSATVAGGGSLYLVASLYQLFTRKEGMGGGDIKLLAMMGAFFRLESHPLHYLCQLACRFGHRCDPHAHPEKGLQAGYPIRAVPCFRRSPLYIFRQADDTVVPEHRGRCRMMSRIRHNETIPLQPDFFHSVLACLPSGPHLDSSKPHFLQDRRAKSPYTEKRGRPRSARFPHQHPSRRLSCGHEDAATDRFVANLARERDFSGIVIINRDAIQLYALGDSRGLDYRLRDTLITGAETSAFSDKGLTLMRYAPVRFDGRVIGAARLSLSLTGEYERLKRSGHIFFAYFVLDFILLCGFGSYLLSRIVVLPMKRLVTATERVARGDYSHAVHVPGSAEIGCACRVFHTDAGGVEKEAGRSGVVCAVTGAGKR